MSKAVGLNKLLTKAKGLAIGLRNEDLANEIKQYIELNLGLICTDEEKNEMITFNEDD